jgi:hypothetical protein
VRKQIIRIIAGVLLLGISIAIYMFQIKVFHDTRNTVFYLLQDLAFIPMQVLLITLILNSIISLREKRELIRKMNMVIGAFFSEAGTNLIKIISDMHADNEIFSKDLLVGAGWDEKKFRITAERTKKNKYGINVDIPNLQSLMEFLKEKRSFILGLFENANLLEHDTFTDMLWAVFHLSEELNSRDDLKVLPRKDYEHLAGDVSRAYGLLIHEWLFYMCHLKSDYPYLYSLAVRKNPFDKNASVVIGE